MNNIEVGRVVVSTAGHDKGEKFIVLEVLDENFVLIVDGKTRIIDNSKKKKVKHLKTTEVLFDDIAKKIRSKNILDAEIRKALKTLK